MHGGHRIWNGSPATCPMTFATSFTSRPRYIPWAAWRAARLPPFERLAVIADDFDFLRFDTGGLIAQEDKAAVEIFIHYRHRETGTALETTIGNFWSFEDGWPVRLSEYHNLVRIQDFKHSVAALTSRAL